MSDVTLSVGGRSYTVACADGDEDRVRNLASMVDATLEGVGLRLNTPMEAKNLLIAGLILADQVDEARRSVSEDPASDAERAAALEKLADRLENAADRLETGASSA